MLVHIKELVEHANKNKYALGAFNIHNLETALGVARAAVAANSPAIIQVSEGTIKYMGLELVTHLVSIIAENEAAAIPIALHLDHGKSFQSIVECVNAGFFSVHMDGSSLALDENIKITRQAIDFARPKGVWVQGEVGPIVGGHGAKGELLEEVPLADINKVKEFVAATDVDTIAPAVGTAHGNFTNEKIDFDLIASVKKVVGEKTIVMHGGSGIADNDLQKAISLGINIINIGSHVKEEFSQAVIKTALANKDETDPRNLLTPGIAAVTKIVMDKMKVFGSAGKA